MYVYVLVCVDVCMYVCMYVCVNARTLNQACVLTSCAPQDPSLLSGDFCNKDLSNCRHDRVRSEGMGGGWHNIRLHTNTHISNIRTPSFLWLHCPVAGHLSQTNTHLDISFWLLSSPANGDSHVSNSNRSTPKLHQSTVKSCPTSPPLMISGAMYSTVPQ